MAQSRVQGILYSVGVVRHVETAGGRFVPVADARTVGDRTPLGIFLYACCFMFLMLLSVVVGDFPQPEGIPDHGR